MSTMDMFSAALLGPFERLEAPGDAPPVDAVTCGCPPTDAVGLERTRYFARQLVGPDDLMQDQRYFRDKHRRHNRLLHGWGVVCGARVMADPDDDCSVIVEPGYVLGPWGDEIVIPHRVRVPLCRQDMHGDAVSPCGGNVDPWCTDVRVDRGDDEPLYLAVRYAECDTRPVRVSGCGCGCDDEECEYSRTRDSYAIRALTELPRSHERLSQLDSLQGLIWGLRCLGDNGRACPPCPEEPWVVLADVRLSGGKVATIDCFAHRRYVASAALFYFQCGARLPLGDDARAAPAQLYDMKSLAASEQEAGPPPATVAVRLGEAWTSMPVAFAVEEGDTVASVLEREGDRELLHPAGGVYTVRELFVASRVDPAARVASRSELLALIEGQTLDVPGLRTVRGTLGELLAHEGSERLDAEHAGAPERAPELPAAQLAAVAGDKRLGRALADITVAELAAADPDELAGRAGKGLRKAQGELLKARAREAVVAAQRITKLAQAWGADDATGGRGRRGR
jgi:hypothetical protein